MTENRNEKTIITEQTADSRNKPYVLVYGDDETQSITKSVWAATSTLDVLLGKPKNLQELEEGAVNAVLIVIHVSGGNDPLCGISEVLWRNPDVICDIVAIAPDVNLDERMRIMSQGFDNFFNTKHMNEPHFQKILKNKAEKGKIRLNNRTQQEEFKRFKAALAASPDAFIVFDSDKKVFFVSEHYRRAYPANPEFLERGTPVAEAFHNLSSEQNVHPGSPAYNAMEKFWTTLEGQTEFTLNDGRTWRITAAVLPDNQGWIVTTTDISDYLEYQKLLEEKSDALAGALLKEKEASEIQKQFINMISHEFRTPLTIIDGNAQIIQKRGETLSRDELSSRCKTIRSSVSRLIYMFEGVLSSNMLKTGNMELIFEDVDVEKIIKELADEQEQLSPSLTIKLNFKDMPPHVRLDRKVLILVITNLLSNAIKFSRNNPVITIDCFIKDGKLHLDVSDKGIGIPENEIDRVFDRYYRTSLSKNVTGSGIGLNLVRDLIDLHGGDIGVSSTEGEGATFSVQIPVTN